MGMTFNSPRPSQMMGSPLDLKLIETIGKNERYNRISKSNLVKKISFKKFQTIDGEHHNETRRSLEKIKNEVPQENFYHHFNRYNNNSPEKTNSALATYENTTKKLKATFHNPGANSTLIKKFSQNRSP
jgi:hypothetical protein